MAKSFEDRSCAGESQAAPRAGNETAHAPAGVAFAELAQRFERQVRFAPLGRVGQGNLVSARVLVVGCGALGGILAQTLFRAGVGELVLVDRDVVELSNLPRQVLFDERHAREGTPKALAAKDTLEQSGGPSVVRAHVLNLDARNLELVADDVDLVLDGTDNLETRYLLNDFCIARGLPWVYAGVVGSSGLVLPILPGRSACLACVFPEPPPAGVLPTCETAGVLLPAVGAVASFAAGLGLRLIARPDVPFEPALIELDTWNGDVRRLSAPRDPDCRVCGRREFVFLHRPGAEAISLCGRNTVQIPTRGAPHVLGTLARSLPPAASEVRLHEGLLRFAFEGCRVSVFPDGRALVEGTSDVARARSLHARALGRVAE
ncbi:MAG: thiazole biosynthesis adenylyltransferase ThiF [Planctomycetes bacterium]|nr:thiazole biosynthesis adenylyltransferase ThiF [Planctomycetota bacterium]